VDSQNCQKRVTALSCLSVRPSVHIEQEWRTEGWGFGVFKPPPTRNSEDTGGVLDRMSKKNRRLDFLL